MALNFFILLTFYFFIRGLQNESSRNICYGLSYFAMGIGFMIKGPPAIIIPTIVIAIFISIVKGWKKLPQLKIGSGILILSIIILPWFVTMLSLHGDDFKNHILGAELHDRIAHDLPFSFYYFGVIIRYYIPWSLFFLCALIIQFRLMSTNLESASNKNYLTYFFSKPSICFQNLKKNNNQYFLFCLIWIAIPLIIFTLFRIEHSRYMLPICPAIAMITANYFLD